MDSRPRGIKIDESPDRLAHLRKLPSELSLTIRNSQRTIRRAPPSAMRTVTA